MKKILSLLFWALLFALCACSPRYYVPNTQHIAMIDRKGKTNLTVSGDGEQGEFQAAYGVGEHIGLMADGAVYFPQNDENGNGGSGNLVGLGVGYYKNFTENILFDTYIIGGIGKMKNHLPTTLEDHPGTTGKISAKVYRFGLQPSLSYNSPYFSITGSARFVNLMYHNISGNLIYKNKDQVDYLNTNKTNFLIEPAITLRAGLPNAKLQLQYLYSFNMSNSSFRQARSLISIGANFSF